MAHEIRGFGQRQAFFANSLQAVVEPAIDRRHDLEQRRRLPDRRDEGVSVLLGAEDQVKAERRLDDLRIQR